MSPCSCIVLSSRSWSVTLPRDRRDPGAAASLASRPGVHLGVRLDSCQPPHHGLGPHHLQRTPPVLPQPRQHDPEEPVRRRQLWARLAHLPHGDLLSECEVLQRELPLRANRGPQCPNEDRKPSDHDQPNSRSLRTTQDRCNRRVFRRDRIVVDSSTPNSVEIRPGASGPRSPAEPAATNAVSSSTASIGKPRRSGPSPLAAAVADALSTRRVAASARDSPAPTRGACEPRSGMSEEGSRAIGP